MRFDEEKLRKHLYNCLINKDLVPFPQCKTSTCRRVKTRYHQLEVFDKCPILFQSISLFYFNYCGGDLVARLVEILAITIICHNKLLINFLIFIFCRCIALVVNQMMVGKWWNVTIALNGFTENVFVFLQVHLFLIEYSCNNCIENGRAVHLP